MKLSSCFRCRLALCAALFFALSGAGSAAAQQQTGTSPEAPSLNGVKPVSKSQPASASPEQPRQAPPPAYQSGKPMNAATVRQYRTIGAPTANPDGVNVVEPKPEAKEDQQPTEGLTIQIPVTGNSKPESREKDPAVDGVDVIVPEDQKGTEPAHALKPAEPGAKPDPKSLKAQQQGQDGSKAAAQDGGQAKPKFAPGEGPKFAFDKDVYEFGKVKEGDVVKYTIDFVNTGKAPLKLVSVKASCGCTAPEWPREEIKPGERQKIQVKFNTAGKLGRQSKSITVTTNEDEKNVYHFRLVGDVYKSETPAAPAN